MNSTEYTSATTLVEVPLWLRIMTVIYLVVIYIVGVPSNIITAIIYGRTSPRTACDWLILTMSITDAVVCFFSPPLYLRSFLNVPLAWAPVVLCSLEYWLQITAMLASCFLLVVIALDRYVKICLPNKTSLTPLKARNVCIICVIIAATVSIVPFLLRMRNANCYMWEVRYTKATRGYFSSLFCFFTVSFFIVTFAYVSICKQINEKIKRKQRLILDNGLTESTTFQSGAEGNHGYGSRQTLNICFKCREKTRILNYDSTISSLCCCFKTKCFNDNEKKSKHCVKVGNYDNNCKIDALLNENLQVGHSKVDVDTTSDYKQGSSSNHQRTNQSAATSLDSGNLQHTFDNPDLHNIPQNTDSEWGIFEREDSIEIEDNQPLNNTTKQSTRPRVDYKNQLGKIPNCHSNISYSASSHETNRANFGLYSTSGQRNTTELKTSRVAAASPSNITFQEREIAAHPSKRQEQELGKACFPISSTGCKTLHCERCCLRENFARDIKDDTASSKKSVPFSFNNRIGQMRNFIFASREFDKFRSSLSFKPDISFLHAGSLTLQKAGSCPDIRAAGGVYRNNCCCYKCNVVCNRTSNIYSTMVDQDSLGCLCLPVSVDVPLSKNRFTQTKCNLVTNKTTRPTCPSRHSATCQQLQVDLSARNVQPLGGIVFNTSMCSLVAKSEPFLAGNNTRHSIYFCWWNGRKPLPVAGPGTALDLTSPCDRPQSYMQVCSDHLKGANYSRSVSFSDMVKEIPLEFPSPDNQLSSRIPTYTHEPQVCPETVPLPSKFVYKNQHEIGDTDTNVKDTETLIPPSLFPRNLLRSTGSLYCRESSQGETGDLCTDLPREAIFSRGVKRRQFKNSKESVMSTGSRKRFARERQMTRMLCSVTAAFLLSWIPPWVIYLLCLHASLEYSRSSIYPFLTTIYLFNYAASPVIYYTFNSTFRSKVNSLMTSLARQFYCSRKARTSDVTT